MAARIAHHFIIEHRHGYSKWGLESGAMLSTEESNGKMRTVPKTKSALEAEMTKDDMIRAYRVNSASWPAIVGLYAVLVGGMVFSASAML